MRWRRWQAGGEGAENREEEDDRWSDGSVKDPVLHADGLAWPFQFEQVTAKEKSFTRGLGELGVFVPLVLSKDHDQRRAPGSPRASLVKLKLCYL